MSDKRPRSGLAGQQPGLDNQSIDGPRLLAAALAAASYLSESARVLDQINVYPVPDNDTGTNMATTLRRACDQAQMLPPNAGANQVLAGLARGAINSSRGNSGVILSQALSSLAESAVLAERIDGHELARGFRAASRGARAAVVNPVEGTMLTVLQAAADGARQPSSRNALAVLESSLSAAEIAAAKTTDQLPPLRRAGVTDAGGEAICVILRGLVANLRGETPVPIAATNPVTTNEPDQSTNNHGYCLVILLIPNQPADDFGGLRRCLSQKEFDSVVIAIGQKVLRIHLHTQKPEPALAEIERFGTISQSSCESLVGHDN